MGPFNSAILYLFCFLVTVSADSSAPVGSHRESRQSFTVYSPQVKVSGDSQPQKHSSDDPTPNSRQELHGVDVAALHKEKKPTKYHYYPHNQHIYLLPECATQQVCNAVYLRLNYTQPLCACPPRFSDPCSASTNSDDRHTVELKTDSRKKPLTIVKTCEAVQQVRECTTHSDWSILALQNIRTGKSHYLIICRCLHGGVLDGPLTHNQPVFANVPGIRVYGMVCRHHGYNTFRRNSRSRRRLRRSNYGLKSKFSHGPPLSAYLWNKVVDFAENVRWE